MPLPFLQVDAFTSQPFAGNPAAVVVLDRAADEPWMQQVAAEMNLAETAFLVPRANRESDGYDLRWFTPTIEVDLCGHATLASAHALWQRGDLPEQAVARFHTRSGLLTATRLGDWIELDFPATLVHAVDAPPELLDALGTSASYIGRSKFDYLVEIDSEAGVRALTPNYARLRTLAVRGVIVTSRATTKEWDFVSRFFAPGSGIDEDPVTGSAHCALTPYWSQKLGKTTFTARQMSPRGGTLKTELAGDRVKLRGQAVTVLRGEIV
ncbi:MAG TPA: PhzF family phenazine biosynthesis protein [Vicinamibacterales bacterium]|nr:PhzF family phenazine biosynthesis protein [Vicinamibacterales bacterium]